MKILTIETSGTLTRLIRITGAGSTVVTTQIMTGCREVLFRLADTLGLDGSQDTDKGRRVGSDDVGLVADEHPISAAPVALLLLVAALVDAEHFHFDTEQLLQFRPVVGSQSVQFHRTVVGRSVR